MFNRVKASIVFPEYLIEYRKDGYFKVLLYMAFFALLMATPLFVSIVQFDGTSPRVRSEISENLQPLETACVIEEGTLLCDQKREQILYDAGNFQVIINSLDTLDTSEYSGFTYYFVVHEEYVHVVFLSQVVQSREITSLEESVHNLDFADEADFVTDQIMDAVDTLVLGYRVVWGSVAMVAQVLANLLIFHAFILINVVLIRGRMREVLFKQLFVMMTYASTLLFIVLIFDAIYNLNIFMFILMLFIAFRQTNRLALAILSRIKRP